MSYEDVTKIVPGLHGAGFKYIIHLGVGRSGFITLETRADSGGYFGPDIYGRTGPLVHRGVYFTKWDVEKLLKQLLGLGLHVHPDN